MLAARRRQSIGHQYQRPIAQPHRIATIWPRQLVEHAVEAELAPHYARRQHRPPIPRADRSDVVARDATIVDGIAVQQAAELIEIEMRCQQIPAAEIDDSAVPGLASWSR
jgi:hypothetical protein